MPGYLLDSNHLSAALRKTSPVRDRIHQGRRVGHRFISCYPVLCELEVGIQQTSRPDDNRRRLAQLLRHVRLWPLDAATARLYGEVYLELRRAGRALSQVDIVLAALARQHKLTVLTTDRDFEALKRFARRELGRLSPRESVPARACGTGPNSSAPYLFYADSRRRSASMAGKSGSRPSTTASVTTTRPWRRRSGNS